MEQEKQIEKDFFDRIALEDQEYQRFAEGSYAKIFSLFKSLVDPKPGDSILDMGCGTGAFTQRLKQEFPSANVLGMDISEQCINRARKSYADILFSAGDVEKTNLDSHSIDIICYFGALHHFPDFNNVAREAGRILRPGGKVFSLDPHHHNPVFWLFRAHESPLYCSKGVTSQERLLTTREFKEVFAANGFTVRTKVISGIKFATVEAGFMKLFMPVYNVLDQILGLSPLAPLIGAWVVGFAQKPV
jgi:ubiquinone/menaquinone biosynthesis C-methylase UbiE